MYQARRSAQADTTEAGLGPPDGVYIASFSSRTIVYKGMVQSVVLPQARALEPVTREFAEIAP